MRVGSGSFAPVTPATDDDQRRSAARRREPRDGRRGLTARPRRIRHSSPGSRRLPAPLLLELDALTPATAAFAQYAASLAQQLPNLAYLTVGPAPTAPTAAQYVATVSSVRDAVHARAPDVAVGMVIDGAAAPKQTVAALGKAGAGCGLLAFRAAPAAATGAWTQPNITLLTNAFAGTLPPLLLDTPTAATVNAAACATTVTGVALDPAAPDAATAAAVAAVARGTVVCPGLAATPTPTTVEYPADVTSGTPVAMQPRVRPRLPLRRDARRRRRPGGRRDGAASLTGGAAPTTVALPKTQLGQASYTIDVRLVEPRQPGPRARSSRARRWRARASPSGARS